MRKLIIVLLAAVLILVFGMIAAMLTSCGVQATPSVPITPTVQHDCICDGTIYHPYSVNAFPGTPEDPWQVTTVHGHETWYLSWLVAAGFQRVKRGDYITYYPYSAWSNQADEYQVSRVDVKHRTMSAIILGN